MEGCPGGLFNDGVVYCLWLGAIRMISDRLKMFIRHKAKSAKVGAIFSLLLISLLYWIDLELIISSLSSGAKVGLDASIQTVLAGPFDFLTSGRRFSSEISIHPNGEDWLFNEYKVIRRDDGKYVIHTYVLKYNKRTKQLYRYDLPSDHPYAEPEFSHNGEYISSTQGAQERRFSYESKKEAYNDMAPHHLIMTVGYNGTKPERTVPSIFKTQFIFFRIDGQEYHAISPDLRMDDANFIGPVHATMSLDPSNQRVMYVTRWGLTVDEKNIKNIKNIKDIEEYINYKRNIKLKEHNRNYRLFYFDIKNEKYEMFSDVDMYGVLLGERIRYLRGGRTVLVLATNLEIWRCYGDPKHIRHESCEKNPEIQRNVMRITQGEKDAEYPLFPEYEHVTALTVNEKGLCAFLGRRLRPEKIIPPEYWYDFVFADCNNGQIIKKVTQFPFPPNVLESHFMNNSYSISPDWKYALSVSPLLDRSVPPLSMPKRTIVIRYLDTNEAEFVDIPPLKSATLIKLDTIRAKINQ